MAGKHPSGLRAAAFVGVAVLAAFLVALAAVGVSATTLRGCTGCHYEDATFKQATQNGPHGQVPCVSCHVDTSSVTARAKFGVYEVFGMRLPLMDPSSAAVAEVQDEQCVACHRAVSRQTVEARGIRIKHSSCAEGRNCSDCHSATAHGAATHVGEQRIHE